MAEMADVLEAAELGAELWVRGFGRSMWPVLGAGDAVKVRRCGVRGLRRGHLVAVRTERGILRVHVVLERRPFRCAPFLGGGEADSAVRVLGRVVALRSRGIGLALPDRSRLAVAASQRFAAWAVRHAWAQALGRTAWRALCSAQTRELRRAAVGPLRVRRLTREDRDAVLAFVGDHLPLSVRFVDRQLTTRWERRGAAAGAVGRGGRLHAFAWLDQYAQEGVALDGWWIRSVYVGPLARGLGLAGGLLDELCGAARAQGIGFLEADVLAENRSSLQVFEHRGFVDAPIARTRAVEAATGRPGQLVVMQRTLSS